MKNTQYESPIKALLESLETNFANTVNPKGSLEIEQIVVDGFTASQETVNASQLPKLKDVLKLHTDEVIEIASMLEARVLGLKSDDAEFENVKHCSMICRLCQTFVREIELRECKPEYDSISRNWWHIGEDGEPVFTGVPDSHKDFRYKNIKDLQDKAESRALEFLKALYATAWGNELENFLNSYDVWFTKGSTAWHKGSYKSDDRTLKIGINPSNTWNTYKRKTLDIYARNIKLPRLLLTTLVVIHEYTHAVQAFRWIRNLGTGVSKAGEVETTKNEFAYIKCVHPSTISKCTKC